MSEKERGSQDVKTYYKSLGFCSFGIGSEAAEIDVKDGKIIRIRPLRYDKKDKPVRQWKIKARGKTFEPTKKTPLGPFSYVYKKRVYSPNRILYPLKRVDWDPDGERNPQNRGRSKFVRITWDEAAELIAKEIKRICEKYGSTAVLVQGDGHGETKAVHGPHGCQLALMDLLGGCTVQARQPDSWEGWYWGAKHVWGQDPVGQGRQTNLIKDISEHTTMMLFWGCDPETTPLGWGGMSASRLCLWFRELGIKIISICPDLNYAAAVHADKWIPVLPNTDAALQLAIAYTWITEGTYDKEYVATHTYGFEEFKKYVLGEEDGVPKTPKWAEPLCGVPARIIKALSRKWAKETVTIAHCNGGSYIRSCYATEPGRLEVLLLAMQGLGKPGTGQLKFFEWQLFGLHDQNPMPRKEVIPTVEGAYRGGILEPPKKGQFIPKTLVPKAILSDEPITWYGHVLAGMPREDQFIQFKYPADGCSEIHMIWSDSPCWSTCWNGGNEWIRALRSPKIECVVVQHPWLENDCLFADIILPINTKFEEEDIGVDIFNGNYNVVLYEGQCIEPLGESKSDYEAVAEVAKKLGLYEQYTQSKTIKEWIKSGFEKSGISDRVNYEEWLEKGYYLVPPAEDWENDEPGFSPFYKDPENNPIDTPSGKIEFYATGLAEHFPDDKERPPVPHWIPYGESHQESLQHPRSKKYPFLIVSNHPRWRVHAQLDDVPWLREIPTCKVKGPDGYLYEPVWINPVDAKALGIKTGDVVKIYNDRGWVLGGAYVTERIIPGAVYQDHGTRLDLIVPGESDRGGANNLICPTNTTSKNCAGEVTSGYLVGIEKVDIEALKKEYPEVFNRPYDPQYGVDQAAWIIGGDK